MNTKTTPKDFFLHLGSTITLYVAVGALINLWFTVINYYFPDQLAGYFYGNAVAWPISLLIVLVPILYILEWLIERDITRMPEKVDLWIRKWRIYLTLFLTVILFGGDLIALINTYLNGEITARLIYKVIVVLLIAGVVGKYYFFNLHRTHRWAAFSRRVHPWVGIVIVVAAIVIGFIAVGSPSTQRAIRFDQQRTSDLQTIQWQIINHWQQKELLPASLNDLTDKISGYTVPVDPETELAYEYNIRCSANTGNAMLDCKAPLSFELCATFGRASQDLKGRGVYGGRGGIYPMSDIAVSYPSPIGMEDAWDHAEGRVCFDRTIDPDKYPVTPKPMKDY